MRPQLEPARDALTDATYWDDRWKAKSPARWADLGWIRERYSWVALDRVLRGRLPVGRDKRFLEVGCATGRWLVYFHKTFGYPVTGCDYSEPGCVSARAALAAAGIDGEVVQQDLFNLDGRYSVVFSGGLIEHFTEPERVLAKFVSLLEPGGVLVTLVPNLSGLSGLYHRLFKRETFQTHRVITLAELTRWHRELGLARVDVGALGSFVPTRFPREQIRRAHPRVHRLLSPLVLRPATSGAERLCLWALTRLNLRVESQAFSPYLYAIAERR